MAIHQPTFRHADGERIPGTWRHIFIRNGGYHLTDLIIYADGLVDCWGLVTLDELAEKLRTGWVATELPDGARASAHHVGSWTFAQAQSWISPEELLGEVRDEIDRLNNRPNSTQRCLAAADAFLADQTEERRAELRRAYLDIPEHLRRYALGDMDSKDWPLKVLVAGPGACPPGADRVVSEEHYAGALAYFAERTAAREKRKATAHPDEPRGTAIDLPHVHHPNGWPAEPGRVGLRNDYPAPVVVDGVEYPTVSHAFWALSTEDEQHRAAIRAASNGYNARKAAEQAPRRPGWEPARTAVMARLLRAKYAQHPELAAILLATGDAALRYSDSDSPRFWGQHGAEGRNWAGRLLELVRAELAAEAAGI
ncbi:NADAR family protein [Kitasatospora sp. NPDC002227]|uniref:NADAR family protein n=1 Tax=Kitasatospora sp. NPDC002227 TaxID=3154773 RepID=UPI00332D4D4F